MSIEEESEKIFDSLKVVDKMYEHIRLVDPITKKVIASRGETICSSGVWTFCW
ncbi:hypothetical protein [Desulfitobacterium sp.]|uniref:hypothetical protein n=1 Tax=Desulfitobacterium sp. TaxID=49981 RepID=UPI002CFBC336|nr:hypothetical protein [Desulfitobacterium sp.]HVJ49691.1 hypothetical protein [Desulfitobacterium sp.]